MRQRIARLLRRLADCTSPPKSVTLVVRCDAEPMLRELRRVERAINSLPPVRVSTVLDDAELSRRGL